jgi:hypothetical protein
LCDLPTRNQNPALNHRDTEGTERETTQREMIAAKT